MAKRSVSMPDDYPLIDQGLYDAIVTACDIKESMTTGNEYFQFDMEVINGPWKGHKLPPIRNMLNLSDNNYYLKLTLAALAPERQWEGIVDIDTNDIVGMVAQVQVAHREYEGKLVADIVGVFPLERSPMGDDGPPPIDDPGF